MNHGRDNEGYEGEENCEISEVENFSVIKVERSSDKGEASENRKDVSVVMGEIGGRDNEVGDASELEIE
jgi:hypothetical protein